MIDIIEPCNRIRIPEGSRITSIANDHSKIYAGLSNGDVLVYTKSPTPDNKEQPGSAATTTSGKIRSLNDVKSLFSDNSESKFVSLTATFKNVSSDGTAIDNITTVKLGGEPVKSVIVVTTESSVRIFEIIGTHINQIYKVEDSKAASAVLYLEQHEQRLLYVGIKKKLVVFQISNKTRNLFSFVKLHELTMKDKIRTIDKFNGKILVGLSTDYWIINDQFEVSPLDDTFTHPTSFSYFGLSPVPRLWTINQDDTTLLVRDTQAVTIEPDLTMAVSPVKFQSVPLQIVSIYPLYLLAVYSKKIEVIDSETGDLIQRFQHYINSNQIYITGDDAQITISSGSDILQFTIAPYQQQIDQYLALSGPVTDEPKNDLKHKGLAKAISLVTKIPVHDSLFTGEKAKHMMLRKLYTSKAILLFNSYSKYHEALVEIGSEWLVSFHDILSLFPDFINGESSLFPESLPEEKEMGAIKRVKVDDLTGASINTESEYDTDTASRRSPTLKKSPVMIRRFQKAVNNLIIYLTDQRRILASFQDKPTMQWKGIDITPREIYPAPHDTKKTQLEEVATIIDTSLFLCYFHVKPMLLGPLLRLPSNRCDSKVVNQCLSRGNFGASFIKELLDFYYGRNLHDEALSMLHKLAHESTDELVQGPTLTIQYLQKLTGDHIDLVFKYAGWVLDECDEKVSECRLIFMNDSYQCESYDPEQVLNYLVDRNLGVVYLEWLLNDSDFELKGKQLTNFETKLATLYLDSLKLFTGDDENFYALEYYTKLYNFLKVRTHYDPWKTLKQIPTTQDKFLRLVIFVYKRLEEHQKSIDVLFNQLNDLEGAMDYALDIYGTTPHLGTGLFHKLLDDLLNYDDNFDKIETLLSLHGTKMQIHKVLTQLPDTFPISKLTQFLTHTFANNHKLLHNSRIKAQLYKVGTVNMEDKVLKIQSEGYKISSSKQACAVCNKRLGYAVFGVTKDNQVVHYGCLQSR
ncbi:uncharacterized protein SPAPADRAFT_50087 [Spathaspora passalidarum NRRL Y-27907]|uniref:CNH domain-containing protein n=1 Tax=Spathaspora passalidarum (strain NRRL Y-27907 / 11-Y1) TaxID=619300 RepID=G3ALD2_SPAPN|nr:uncharacterized protein SPAPADRAFT_50087 [Spathaspora passalidarum NRRL Y-27907]EGW33175.1 hypothetical protein SPAPADRAFT_50087 [Spathaspora passalidarum NRRL Y-27907]